jgi:hypothetical protein
VQLLLRLWSAPPDALPSTTTLSTPYPFHCLRRIGYGQRYLIDFENAAIFGVNSSGDGSYLHGETFSIGAPLLRIEVGYASIGVPNEYFLHHRRRGRSPLRCRLLRTARLNKQFDATLATITTLWNDRPSVGIFIERLNLEAEMKVFIGCAAIIFALATITSAEAKGCLRGAVVGGVAGHVAGHHAVLGAAAGCVIGRHEANKRDRMQKYQTDLPNREFRNGEERL